MFDIIFTGERGKSTSLTSYKMAAPMHDMIDGLFSLEMMVENLFCCSNLHGRNSRVQKNNYDFDKMTVVEIQEGSNY